MGDGYFYTLSAIAQSFAAIIALSAVFVIYKLQVLKNQHTELIKKLRNIKLRDMTKYHSFSREVAVDELDRMTDESLLNWAESPSGVLNIVDVARKTFSEIKIIEHFSRVVIPHWIKITLATNVTTIVFSLVLLPWKNLISFFQYIVLVITLGFSILSLFVTVQAVLTIIEMGRFSVVSNVVICFLKSLNLAKFAVLECPNCKNLNIRAFKIFGGRDPNGKTLEKDIYAIRCKKCHQTFNISKKSFDNG